MFPLRSARITFVSVSFSLGLAGCAPSFLSEVKDPAPIDVVNYIELFQPFSTRRISSGADYVWAGYSYVDHHCAKFFNALEQSRMHLTFAKESSAAGFGLATSVLTALEQATKHINIVTAAGSFVQAGLTAYSNGYLYNQFLGLSQFSGSLWLQTSVAMNNYKNLDAGIAGLVTVIANKQLEETVEVQARAHNIVQGYARLCSIQQQQVFIQTALLAAPAKPADDKKKDQQNTPDDKQTPGKKQSVGQGRYSTGGAPKAGGMTGYVIRRDR